MESGGEVTDGLTLMEELHTTVIGNGVAIPHATIEGVDGTILMVAVSDRPIEFGPSDQDLCSVTDLSSKIKPEVQTRSFIMPDLRIGVCYDFRNPPDSGFSDRVLYGEIMSQVQWLDKIGADLVWFTEHHLNHISEYRNA